MTNAELYEIYIEHEWYNQYEFSEFKELYLIAVGKEEIDEKEKVQPRET